MGKAGTMAEMAMPKDGNYLSTSYPMAPYNCPKDNLVTCTYASKVVLCNRP